MWGMSPWTQAPPVPDHCGEDSPLTVEYTFRILLKYIFDLKIHSTYND